MRRTEAKAEPHLRYCLEKIIELYISIWGSGISPKVPRPGFEPGSRARKAR